MKAKTTIAMVIAACAVAIPKLYAWAEASVWDGIYTQAQAARGQVLYAKECVSCHRDDLQGHGTTPSLAGADFIEKWDGQTVGDLFEKIQASMPANHPGTLSREQNATVLAFILRCNEFPPGEVELRTDSEWLGKVFFRAAKSK